LPFAPAQAQTPPLNDTGWDYKCYNMPVVPANGQCPAPLSTYVADRDICFNQFTYVITTARRDADNTIYCPQAMAISWRPVLAGDRPMGGPGSSNVPGSGSSVNSGVPCDFGTMDKGLCIPNNPVCANGGTGIACTGNVTELIAQIINIMLYFAGIIAVVFIIIGGYRYMTSAGSTEGAGAGKKTLINAIIGLVIVILAYVIVRVVTNFLM
jgi:hypothetical protein